MKNLTYKIIFTLALSIVITTAKSQTKQLNIKEALSLFEKSKTEIYNELKNKGYNFSKKDSDFEIFKNSTQIGEYQITLIFKNGVLNTIGWQEHLYFFRNILSDLNTEFTCQKQNSENCLEYLDNSTIVASFEKKGYVASLIQRKDETNLVSVNIGKTQLENTTYENKEKSKPKNNSSIKKVETTPCKVFKSETWIYNKKSFKNNAESQLSKVIKLTKGMLVDVVIDWEESPNDMVKVIYIDKKGKKHIGYMLTNSLEFLKAG